MSRLAFFLVISIAASVSAHAADEVRRDEKGTYLGVLFGPRPAPSSGVVITHVLPGSPAEKAQVRTGDVLLRYDQTTIRDAEHLAQLIRADKPERKIALVLQRDQRLRLAEVTLALGPALKLTPAPQSSASKTTAPTVTVYASPVEGGKMRLTIEYQSVGGKKKTVTCEGVGSDLADAVEKLPPRERNLVRIAIQRLNTLNEPKQASSDRR